MVIILLDWKPLPPGPNEIEHHYNRDGVSVASTLPHILHVFMLLTCYPQYPISSETTCSAVAHVLNIGSHAPLEGWTLPAFRVSVVDDINHISGASHTCTVTAIAP